MLKNKLKTVLVIIISIIFTSGLSVFATYNYLAKDISYTKADGTETSVENSLNELYQSLDNAFNSIQYIKETNVLISNGATAATESVELQNGKYLLIVGAKSSDYTPNISLTGDDSIQEITPRLAYNGSGSETVSGYHARKRKR